MQFTPEQFKTIFPANKNPGQWMQAFAVLSDFGITSPEQVAIFCAQVGHESLDMTTLKENLNYSADGLMRTFPKYFRDVNPNDYARQPEKIANRVYANRMGNGNEELGDGWRYRGSGPLMLTGYDNFYQCSLDLYGDATILVDDPDLVREDPDVGLKTALWFWKKNNLVNNLSIESVSRRVNGGTIGRDDRIMRFERSLKVL
jgi:putative chitinase